MTSDVDGGPMQSSQRSVLIVESDYDSAADVAVGLETSDPRCQFGRRCPHHGSFVPAKYPGVDYGASGIPATWRSKVAHRETLESFAERLYEGAVPNRKRLTKP